MNLVSAKIGPFKSIESPQTLDVERKITVLVGMNEAGKTVCLQALHKSDDVLGVAKFKVVDDYPRKNLTAYETRHESKPEIATALTYQLSAEEIDHLNKTLGVTLSKRFQFAVSHNYKNERYITLPIDERPVLADLATREGLTPEYRQVISSASTLRAVAKATEQMSLGDADKLHLAKIAERVAKCPATWDSVVGHEAWQYLGQRTPKFLYFGDYEILPSKMNLADLAPRANQAAGNPGVLTAKDRGVLALLRMANIKLEAFSSPGDIESLVARMESVSIRLTDQIMEFWKQNEDLEVRIDIRPDSTDQPPFNTGPNLYLRIANKRHRGVTTPFEQRSKGFIWFFSFLVWFDSVQHQLAVSKEKDRPLILLLDEPGLSLHALAQRDFLRYIDGLGERHQVLYTTHSPFMIHSDRLHEVRVVEDRPKLGTVISDNVSWTDERTVFPLQAALGWTIAQNLFISERNLLVEGPADLVYLQAISSLLESGGRAGLRDDVTIVPTGGLDKVLTFIALLGANKLQLAVLHDYRGTPEQKLLDLIRQKMISAKAVMDASQFRDLSKLGVSGRPTDLEDLFEVSEYLTYFNAAFAAQLGTAQVVEADLPAGDRVIERLERYITTRGISLRPSGGFNHYAPASAFARNPPNSLGSDSMKRFEALFRAVNGLF
jgi:hypothetical protein